MQYINNLYIETFKGIEGLTLSDLGNINILVGNNNTCKTTVLEAVQLFQFPCDFREMIRIARKRDIAKRIPRGITMMESFLNMFNASQQSYKMISLKCEINDTVNSLEIIGEAKDVYITTEELDEISKDKRLIVHEIDEETPIIEFVGNVNFNDTYNKIVFNEIIDTYRYGNENANDIGELLRIKYVSSIDHLNETFSARALVNAIKNDEKSKLLDLLRMFDSEIEGIEMLPGKNMRGTITYIKHSKYGFMPLSTFGDGVKKVLTLASALLSVENGLLLIDEIETAIHTSGLDSVFTWLIEASKRLNVQIIATTHSDEALRSLLANNTETSLKMCIYRLERLEHQVIARRFSGKKAYDIVIKNGGDLR